MSMEDVVEIIRMLLALGVGVVIQWLYRNWVEAQAPTPSPFSKAMAMLALCIIVPTTLYLLLVWATELDYSILHNVLYCALGYVGSQIAYAATLSRTPGA